MTAFGALLGFITAFYIGFFAVSIFAKNMAKEIDFSFRVLFAIPLGFGFCSVLYFFSMLLNLYNFKIYIGIELVILVVLGVVYYYKNKQEPLKKPEICPVLSVVTLYSILIYTRYYMQNIFGSWDGFRIWNIKSEFLFQYTDSWRNVFSLPHFMMHNDYPLFLPATNARLWKYSGIDTTGTNAILGLIFTLATIYLLYFVIKKYKNQKLALVVSSVFALNTTFLVNGAAQCADIPMAYMVLCSIVAVFFYFEKKQNIFLVLGVVFAGIAAWTKNEGLLYLLVYSGILSGMFIWFKEYKKLWIVILTLIPFVILITVFKLTAKAPNDLFMGMVLLKTYRHFFEWSMYFEIVKYLIKTVFMWFYMLFPLILLTIKGVFVNKKITAPWIFTVVVGLAMSAVYFAVYLLSPHDLTWLLENSLTRIILQILPVVVLAFALGLRIFDEPACK